MIVRCCFSLSGTSRRRSANSAWWKFDSPNQRSTRSGTARASSAARSAAARVSARAASCSKVVRPIVSRVLTTMTVGLRPGRDRLGQGPEQVRLAIGPGRLGGRTHDDEVRPLGLAKDRVADVVRLAEDRLAASLDVLLDEWASACSAWARTASVIPGGTKWRTRPWRRDARAMASAIAERELGVRAAADRDEDALDVLRCRAA